MTSKGGVGVIIENEKGVLGVIIENEKAFFVCWCKNWWPCLVHGREVERYIRPPKKDHFGDPKTGIYFPQYTVK